MISIKLQINFIEITLQHACSSVNLLNIFRTPFPRNNSGWLLRILVSCFLLVLGFIDFCILSQKFLFFLEKLSFGFCLVNYDYGAHLAVDHSSVYSYRKMFLLFFSLTLSLISGMKPSFSIHISTKAI